MFKSSFCQTIRVSLVLSISAFMLMACGGTSEDDGTSNSAPTAANVTLTDENGGSVVVGDTLTGSYEYSDVDGDGEGGSIYRWLRGELVIGTTPTYTAVAADSGHSIVFEVTPVATEGVAQGIAVGSPGIAVVNSAPVATNVTLTDENGGSVVEGDILTGSYEYADVDGDDEDEGRIHWLRDGQEIMGATRSTYQVVAADIGYRIVFEAIPFAVAGVHRGRAATSEGVTVVGNSGGNSAPMVTNVTLTDENGGSVEVGDTLTGSYEYSDADGDGEGSSTSRWLRGETVIGTGLTYTVVAADSGHSIVFEVTPVAEQGASQGVAVFSSVVTVQNIGPTVPVVAADPELTFLSTKIFRFTWNDVDDATFYRLLENPDGISGFKQWGKDIPQGQQSIERTVPLFARLNAQYILQSCNSIGCRDASTLEVDATLLAAAGFFNGKAGGGDNFGVSVSLSANGRVMAVGAEQESSNGPSSGKVNQRGEVYLYASRGTAGHWEQEALLKPEDLEIPAYFGRSVSLSGDGNTLAVGAPSGSNYAMIDNTVGKGAVYVYCRACNRDGGNPKWSRAARLTATNAGDADGFGGAVSLNHAGNTLAVGARWEDSATAAANSTQGRDTGAVYTFNRVDNEWNHGAFLKPSVITTEAFFGTSLSLSADGKTLAVGASQEETEEGVYAGAAYVFTFDIGKWTEIARLKASNRSRFDHFGGAVSLSGDGKTLAVGAERAGGVDDNDRYNHRGALYIFSLGTNGWLEQANINTIMGEAIPTQFYFGRAVSLSDNGNSLAVGAADGSGSVYTFTRDGVEWHERPALKANITLDSISLSHVGKGFGGAVSLSGDGNTLAVGVKDADNDGDVVSINSGAVFLY